MNPPALRLLPLCLALLLAGCDEARPLLPANATLPDGGQYRGEIVDGLLQGQHLRRAAPHAGKEFKRLARDIHV